MRLLSTRWLMRRPSLALVALLLGCAGCPNEKRAENAEVPQVEPARKMPTYKPKSPVFKRALQSAPRANSTQQGR